MKKNINKPNIFLFFFPLVKKNKKKKGPKIIK